MAKELVLEVVAKKNSRDLQLLAEEFQKLSDEATVNGKALQKNASFSKFLEDQTIKTKGELAKLRAEFDKTGSLDLSSKIGGLERNLKGLEALGKRFSQTVETGIETGAQDGFKSLGEAFSSLPPQAQIGIGTAVAGAIAVSAAPIGAAINGVLLAGVGLGGVAAGIVGQIKDPAVQSAFARLGSTAENVLTSATKAFGPVLVDTAHEFQDLLVKAEPKLAAVFDRLAPHAEKLFQGLEGLGSKTAPGLFEALDAAGPILDQIAADLPALGHAFSTFFHSIADGAPGAKDALHDLFVITETTIEGVGYLVEGLSKAFTIEEAFGQLIRGDVGGAGVILGDLATNSHAAADAMKDIAGKFEDAIDPASQLAGQLQRINGGLSELIGNQLSVDQANDRFAEDLLQLKDNLDQHSQSLDMNSTAGLHNRDVVLQLIADAQQARDAQIKMAGGADASRDAVDKANKSYDDAISKIEAVGTKAGLSKKDLDNLAGTYQVDVILAVNQVNNSPLAQLVAPHDVNRYGSAGPPKRASGGPVTAGMPYIVGDGGVPELFVPSVSGTILPKVPSGLSSRGWSGGGSTVTFAGDTNSAFATAFMQLVRTGVIQVN